MIQVQKFLDKYKVEIVILLFLSSLYFFLRIYNIMSLPIFTDEAIYVRWSQIAKQDASWRFISLTDGKQPMFVWLALNIMRFISDPLLASRLVSVTAGFFTMLGLYFLGSEIFKNRTIGLLSSFLYVIFPFALVYDRMALYDSLVGTFSVWSLYLEVFLIRRLRLDIALILGMVIGGAVLTKTSGFFNIYLLPSLLLIFDWKKDKRIPNLIKAISLLALAGFLGYVYYSILRLSPFFYIINEKNNIFVYSFAEWRIHPLTFFISNFSNMLDWFVAYLTWPFLVLILASLILNFKFSREKLLLLVWFIVPFIALAVFGKTLYPRFIFFMTLSLLPLAAFSVHEIYKIIKIKSLAILVIASLLVLIVRSDFYILSDISKAPIAEPDISQYIRDWPAGGGISEVIEYLDAQSKNEKIYVFSPGTFGSLPTVSVEIYLGGNTNIEKRGIYPVPDQLPPDLLEKAKTMPVYVFVSNQPEFERKIKTWPVEEVMKIRKDGGKDYTRLYKVRSSY